MPRPRFAKLDSDKREAILDAAALEFGELGFERASYNRIIERAGLSKGAMYYYFDDKEDLFATVLADAAEQVGRQLVDLPPVHSEDAFWSRVGDLYSRVLETATQRPRVAALLPVLFKLWRRAEKAVVLEELERTVRTWSVSLLEEGRRVGAVRDDVPDDLLMSVVFALGEAVDLWLMERLAAREGMSLGLTGPHDGTVKILIDLMRRVVSPPQVAADEVTRERA